MANNKCIIAFLIDVISFTELKIDFIDINLCDVALKWKASSDWK